MKREGKLPFMKWKEFEHQIEQQTNISGEELKMICKWMHKNGVLLYFPLDGNDDRHLLNIPYRSTNASSDNKNDNKDEGNQGKGMVILEPQWLVDVFRSIIDHNRQISKEEKGKSLKLNDMEC